MPNVLDVVGIKPIDVFIPCTCGHAWEAHAPYCAKPCECLAFQDGLPDGPRGFRCRQLNGLEWTEIYSGLPFEAADGQQALEDKPADQLTKAESVEVLRRGHLRLREIVKGAVTHVRHWNDSERRSYWQRVKVLAADMAPDNENWEIGVEQLESNESFMRMIADAVVADLQRRAGGAGTFRARGGTDAAAVAQPGKRLRPAAARGGDAKAAAAR